MVDIQTIQVRREAILSEMRSISSMKRGTINEQFLKVSQKGKKHPVLRGPYYVMSRREGHKTVSTRLTTPEVLEKTRGDVAAYHRFQALAKEFVELTETLGEVEETAAEPDLKKKPKSRSSRMRR